MAWVDVLRAALRRWLQPNARNSAAVALLLSGHDRWPRRIDDWTEQRVAVISPHPDDEAIGCGGALLRHVNHGADVRILHVSDGERGSRRLLDPGLTHEQRRAMQSDLVATRHHEALRWGADAGVREVGFLHAPDGHISPSAGIVHELAEHLERWQPELLYVPFVTDLLEDHWQTSRLLAAALEFCGNWKRDLIVRGYEVWAPLPANRVADITDLAPRKRELLDLYASQLADVDYRRAIEGLNTYRSMMLPDTGCGQAEAFFESSLRGWLDLVGRAAVPPRPQPGFPFRLSLPPLAEDMP